MLKKPDFITGPFVSRTRWVEPGTQLVRLASSSYPSTSCNPKIPPHKPSSRGRFSATKRDPFATMYVADVASDESLVILEVMSDHDLQTNPGGSIHYLKKDDVAGLAFHYLMTTRRFPVVRLTGANDPQGFGATWESLFSANYWYSREWTRYIRQRSPDTKGLEYVSVKNRDTRDGAALVLFGDRFPKGVVEESRPSVPADSREGSEIFMRCYEKTWIVPEW